MFSVLEDGPRPGSAKGNFIQFFRKMLISRHQRALALSERYQETQNSILHQTAMTTFFSKNLIPNTLFSLYQSGFSFFIYKPFQCLIPIQYYHMEIRSLIDLCRVVDLQSQKFAKLAGADGLKYFFFKFGNLEGNSKTRL